MTKKEKEAYNYFIQEYQRLKNLNQPYRDKFNDYIEYYRGYVDKSKYPMAYNYSYNKVLPIILRELESMMSHLYKSGDIVAVKPLTKADIQGAVRVGNTLNFQMGNLNSIDQSGGSYMMMMQWILSSLIFGKGVVKCYWRKEEGMGAKRIIKRTPIVEWDAANRPAIVGYDSQDYVVENTQLLYNGPYVENIPIRQFMPDPEYRDVQQMPCVCHVHQKSLDWIKKQVKAGIYSKRSLREIGKLAQASRANEEITEFNTKVIEIESASTIEEIETDKHSAQNITIIDCYGKYALDGKDEIEVVCTIANYDTILRLEPVPHNRKPFFCIGAHMNPDRFYDMGVIELVKDIQEAYNVLANTRLQVVTSKLNPMLQVLVDSDIDPRFLVFRPFGFIPVTSHDDIKMLETPDMGVGTFTNHMSFFDNMISEMTGVHPYSMGSEPRRQEHVGTMYSLQQMGQSRMRLLLMTMDYMGFRPLLNYMMKLNVYNLPAGVEYRAPDTAGGVSDDEYKFGQIQAEDIHDNYEFSARYVSLEPSLDKPYRIQQLLQLSQTWAQDPSVNQFQFKRAILEMMDMMEPERFLKSEQEVEQTRKRLQQEGYQEEIVRAQWQAGQDDKGRQADVVKELLKGK